MGMKPMGHLLRLLRSEDEDRLTCEECCERLPAYMVAHEEGAQAGGVWAEVRVHLEQCPLCSALYEELASLAQMELPALAPAAPDLSFLRREPLLALDLGALPAAVIRFGRGLVAALAAPGLAPAAAALRDTRGEVREQVEAEQAGRAFSATVTVRSAPADPGRCTLLVTITPAGLAWPDLDGTVVTLRRGPAILAARETDPYGEVSFPDLVTAELPELSIIIEVDAGGSPV